MFFLCVQGLFPVLYIKVTPVKDNTFYALLSKYSRNNLPDSTQKAFHKWFVDGTYQQEKERALEKLWEETDATADESTRKDLEVLYLRIDKAKRKRSVSLTYLLRIAAIFLLPLLGAASMYLYMQDQTENEEEWTESFVARAERKEITLSDGTHVWLNSGSVLIYAKEFKGKERALYLNGEAIFNVAKDPEKPFIVKTHYMDIEALGTVFNIEAYSDAEYTTATLNEGKIGVNVNNRKQVELLPDQQIRHHNLTGKTTRETVDADRVLQWKHGYVTFQKATFDYIIQNLQRRFDVTINYETNKFAGRSFNMRIHPGEDIVHVLDILKEMIPGMQYKINNNVIYIH